LIGKAEFFGQRCHCTIITPDETPTLIWVNVAI
jgi:hypothetical protein